jgi:hypothetical protein
MANKQVNQLTELTSAIDADLVPVYDTQESGTEKLKKMTLDNFRSSLPITTDTTAYVATTGSDVTGDGSSDSPFASVAGALDWLKDKPINDGIRVFIMIKDGHYTGLDTIYINLSDKKNIFIQGENSHDISLTSVQSSSGSAGNWSVVLNVSSVADVVVGDYVIVNNDLTGGSTRQTIMGCWEVTNVDSGNTRITIKSTSKYGSIASGAVTGTITVMKAILSFATDNHGIMVDNGGFITINNFVVVGDTSANSYYGIASQRSASIGSVSTGPIGVNGFSYGFRTERAGAMQLNAQSSSCNNVKDGFSCSSGSVMIADNTTSVGNSGNGYSITTATLYCQNSISIGNQFSGIYAVMNSVMNAYSAIAIYNMSHGILSDYGATIYIKDGGSYYNNVNGIYCIRASIVAAENVTVSNNTGQGVVSSRYGYVEFSGSASSSSNGGNNVSPAVNTQGNEYGYINT